MAPRRMRWRTRRSCGPCGDEAGDVRETLMKALAAFAALVVAAAVVTAARSGHELPIYPSYYPQEIEIATVAPQQAADLLRQSKIQAYVGAEPRFARPLPDSVRAVESLGSFVTVRVNPQSPLA